MYKKILFDFDGTIIDSRAASIEATQRTFLEFNLPPPTDQEVLNLMGIPIEQSFPTMGGASYPSARHDEFLSVFRRQYAPICDEKSVVFPGIRDILEAALVSDLSLAIVTSKKSTVAARTLEGLGLTKFFPVIIGSEHVERYKPDPQPALMAAGRFTDIIGDVLVVGDAATDIEMAHAAGFDACAVLWGAHSKAQLDAARPTYMAEDANDLQKIIWRSN